MTFADVKDGVLLPGLGIGGYRSLRDLRLLAPLAKVTLLAGQNNVGKSNVIRFLERYLQTNPVSRQWDDEPRPSGEPLRLATAHRLDAEKYEQWANLVLERTNRFLGLPSIRLTDDDLLWIVREQDPNRDRYVGQPEEQGQRLQWRLDRTWMQQINEDAGRVGGLNLSTLRQGLSNTTGGTPEDNIIAVLDHLFPFKPPKVEIIRAFRQVTGTGAESDHSGGNLIETLANHQNPGVRERDKHRKFEAINRFLQIVLEDPSVRIEIPARRDYIMVHQDAMVFPLEDLGTGIHQVVIMAAGATLIDDSIVCIEEPEVNLHPVLQRKFVRYLTEQTSNQYVIATHSAHMLDYERASIIHVRKDAAGTILAPASSTHDVSEVCADLGYRPSDILQSNAVIWVEGPSDRIYINHWLRILDDQLPFVENIHYSIMFYGGSNRSHLTGQDPEDVKPIDGQTANDLISLRRLNRHSMIVIDSDRTRARGDHLDDNKIRVRDEFDREDLPGHSWITSCRTIENYVPVDLLTSAVSAAHPKARYQPPTDKWSDPLVARRETSNKRAAIEKVKVANKVAEGWQADRPLPADLKREVKKIHEFIARANPGSQTV